ncbi:MAG: DUF2141 domain-containing protein [Bacteroidales bacterium]|nr:DUF2141 domain-containing protein [Bacteroidales bacterium]
MKKSLLTVIILLFVLHLGAQTVKLNIRNVKTTKGSIQLVVFKDAESFKKDCPCIIKRFSKDSLNDGSITLSMHLPKGEYGIILLDDENDNEDMDNNIIGLPKEGYGFAGFTHRGIRRPKFDNFKFTVEEGVKTMGIRVRYL